MRSDIPKLIDDLARACSKIDAQLVAAEISEAEGGAPFVASVSNDDFLGVCDRLGAKIVYYETLEFNAEALLLSKARIDYEEFFDESRTKFDESGNLLDDQSPLSGDQVGSYTAERPMDNGNTKQFRKKWDKMDGLAFYIRVMFFANGVFHETNFAEAWFQEFEVERDKILEQLHATYVNASNEGEMRRDKEREEMAKILAKHPLFSAKGATKEKREYLAKQIFPERSLGLYQRLVSRASSIIWYENGSGTQ